MTVNLRAKNKPTLLRILRSIDIEGPLLSGSLNKEYTESYAMAHLLSSLVEKCDRLIFPLKVVHRTDRGGKPDFLLTLNEKNIGIEHTDARSMNETRKDVLRRKEKIGPPTYLMTHAEPNEPRRNANQLRKEIESNARDAGWGDQDRTDQDWSRVMLCFIDKKVRKLQAPDFSRFDEDWLLIRDAWRFPSVNLQNATKHLFSKIKNQGINLEFHRVFIISCSDRGPVCEIAESGFRLHPRNDLWLQ